MRSVGFVSGGALGRAAPRFANADPTCRKRAVAASRRAKCSMGMRNIPAVDDGFVNCRGCGSDVVVDMSEFMVRDYTVVRCRECGRRWEAEFADVDVLYEGQIRKATEVVEDQNKKGPKPVTKVSYARRSIRIWVGNLPVKVGDADLQAMFERYGDVKSARVIYDRNTSRSRGFGFVEMADEGEGRAAIQDLDGNRDFGSKIVVRQAESY
mmetsp:Transcript_6990/g.21283  ORF Transcript_6990/g.21283 Transcript_6990/m.21283 type:complete len:210 (-) Transcript_6990:1428-2057(-)